MYSLMHLVATFSAFPAMAMAPAIASKALSEIDGPCHGCFTSVSKTKHMPQIQAPSIAPIKCAISVPKSRPANTHPIRAEPVS